MSLRYDGICAEFAIVFRKRIPSPFEVGALLKVLEFYPSGDSFETLSRQSSWLSLVRFIHFSGKGLRFVLEFPQSSR